MMKQKKRLYNGETTGVWWVSTECEFVDENRGEVRRTKHKQTRQDTFAQTRQKNNDSCSSSLSLSIRVRMNRKQQQS